MSEYRVNLDIYNGPLDLLLYLIRREEVDIHDIPIARITGEYIKYVDLLKQIDPNLAGDFLVLAATLIEIKTRTLLPVGQGDEGEEALQDLDPRAELVRQLLEYKAFKDAASDLTDAARHQAKRYPRGPAVAELADEQDRDLEDVQVWDLFDAFSKLIEAIGLDKPTHEIIYDDTPVALHAEDILDRLQRDGDITFARIFEGRDRRTEIVGLFLALLELTRRRAVLLTQGRNFDEIHVRLNPNPPAEEPDEPPAQSQEGVEG